MNLLRQRGGHEPSAVRYGMFYGAIFLALGFYLPFWPVWLESRGLKAEEIGLLLALTSWVKVGASPLFGHIADRSGRDRLILVGLAGASLLGFAAFLLAKTFWMFVAIQLATAIAFHPLIPLGESRTMTSVVARGLDYGRIRLWGSITFILGTLAAGWLIEAWNKEALAYAIIAALAFTLLAAAGLRDRPPASEKLPPGNQADIRVFQYFQGPNARTFLLFLTTASLLQASHAAYYGFSALHWQTVGHSSATVAWLWTEGVIFEILLFAFSAVLVTRIGPAGLLLVAALGAALRWCLLAWTVDLAFLIGAQALHALSFAAAHLGAMHFIAKQAPPALAATLQSVYAAVSGGIAMGLAMLLAGRLYPVDPALAYAAMAGLAALAAMLSIALICLARLGVKPRR